MIYPTWRYHRTERACIVTTAEEDFALGAGWADSPAAFNEPEPEPEAELKPEPAETKPAPLTEHIADVKALVSATRKHGRK